MAGRSDYVGGSTNIYASNISLTDNGKNYYGAYFNDDWKITPKLTVNLGLRWDFFGLVFEHHGAQANFVPGGPPTGSPMYLLPGGSNPANLSTSFTDLLSADGITLAITNKYGKGLGNSQKSNFAPRVGFAYQVTPKLVARGGFGMFYNGFENRGFSPNLGRIIRSNSISTTARRMMAIPARFRAALLSPRTAIRRPSRPDSRAHRWIQQP